MILTTRYLEWPVMKCSLVAAFKCSVTGKDRFEPEVTARRHEILKKLVGAA